MQTTPEQAGQWLELGRLYPALFGAVVVLVVAYVVLRGVLWWRQKDIAFYLKAFKNGGHK